MGIVTATIRRMLGFLADDREPPKCVQCGSENLKTYSMGADVERCQSCGHIRSL